VPSSVVALTLGCRRHRDVWVLGLGTAGLGLLVVGVALGHVEYWERPMTLGATALIVMAHARNYRLCRRDGCDHEPDACVA
jgi:MerC mercury resistance protein